MSLAWTAFKPAELDWNTAASLPLIVKAGTTTYIPGPNGLLLEQVTGSGTVYYCHADQIGNTRAMTDSTGTVQDTWAYDPYGNLTSSSGSVANPFEFQGQYLDPASGLYYLRNRYVDPVTAQFSVVDEAFANTRERYAYAADSPLDETDPSGLMTQGRCYQASGFLGVIGISSGWQDCIVVDGHGNVAFTTSQSVGPQVGTGTGWSVERVNQASDADTVTDLSGPFSYQGASAGTLVAGVPCTGSYTQLQGTGTHEQAVNVEELGWGIGTPGVSAGGGVSNTPVVRTLFAVPTWAAPVLQALVSTPAF